MLWPMLVFHSFLWLINSPLYVQTTYLLVHQWTFVLFLPLAVVNNAAINTGVKTSFCIPALNFFWYIPRVELLARGNSVSFFQELPHYCILFNFLIVFHGYPILLMITKKPHKPGTVIILMSQMKNPKLRRGSSFTSQSHLRQGKAW